MNTNPADEKLPPSQAEAVAASIEIGAESARVIQHVLSQASNIESRKRVLASYLEVGPAFAAYLLLEETAADAQISRLSSLRRTSARGRRSTNWSTTHWRVSAGRRRSANSA